MAPKKLPSHRDHRKPSQAGQTSARKKTESEAKKKKTSKKPLEAVAEVADIPAAEELQPVADLTKPVQATVEDLRSQIADMEQKLSDLRVPTLPGAGGAPSSDLAEDKEALAKREKSLHHRQRALKVWKSFAAVRLSEMASSLEAALLEDSKLRELFDRVDLDLGGSIDQGELGLALEAAGKSVDGPMLNRMFTLADEDGNGDIDYSEFADVIRGIKVHRAAFAIERGVRRHQARASAARTVGAPKLNRAQLERAFGYALLATTPQALIKDWDKAHRGTLTRQEFRTGAREGFGLAFDNRDVDEWFDRFDKNANGEIDVRPLTRSMHIRGRVHACPLSLTVRPRDGGVCCSPPLLPAPL